MLRLVRLVWAVVVLYAVCAVLPVCAQTPLESYFFGRQVMVKIDMPGTQQGIDLRLDKPVPMDWNSYSARIKNFGIAIHKGDVARVTKFVVKKDMIEFQLDGGGFGTAGDDTTTTVYASAIPKDQYEKDLEKQIATTTDAARKRDLQRDLDRERSRRERLDAKNQSDAAVASQIKAQQVADKRLHGGSRFNLRWQGAVPSDDHNPEAVMKLLAEYVDFNAATEPNAIPLVAPGPPSAAVTPGTDDSAPAVAQLRRGMKMDEVSRAFGPGHVLSETTSNDGLKTMVVQYRVGDSVADVTFVEGVVVRYSINSK